MKILSWNVSGAHLFFESLEDAISYDKEDVSYFSQKIKESECEIIGLQESHTPIDENESSQSKIFADYVKYKYFDTHAYGKSHIKSGNYLSLSNISKYKILRSYFYQIPNPNLNIKRPNGDVWTSFDVGFLISEIEYDGKIINFANGHMVPFHYFKRDFTEPEFEPVRQSITTLFLDLLEKPTLVVCDFNYNDLQKLIPNVFAKNCYKKPFIKTETTPGRGQQDHILCSYHWELLDHSVVKLNSDHYQCIADLKLSK